MIVRLIAGSAVAAAAVLTAVPAQATGVRPCDAGYVGVVVEDPSGDRVTACVYVQDYVDLVNAAVQQGRDVVTWVLRDVTRWVKTCEARPGDPNIVDCDALPPPPLD